MNNFWSDFHTRYPNAVVSNGQWSVSYEIDGKADAMDVSPEAYEVSDPVGTIFSRIDDLMASLLDLINSLSNNGRVIACRAVYSQAMEYLHRGETMYASSGQIALHALDKFIDRVNTIAIISKNATISTTCEIIKGLIGDVKLHDPVIELFAKLDTGMKSLQDSIEGLVNSHQKAICVYLFTKTCKSLNSMENTYIRSGRIEKRVAIQNVQFLQIIAIISEDPAITSVCVELEGLITSLLTLSSGCSRVV